MSNKPKNEKRLVEYKPTKKENRYISICMNATMGKKGSTKNLKKLKILAGQAYSRKGILIYPPLY